MPTVEERSASLEARVQPIADVRNLILELGGDMHARFTSIDARFTSIDARFASVEAWFTSIDTRFTHMDARFTDVNARFTELTGLIVSLDAKVDKHFVWLMG